VRTIIHLKHEDESGDIDVSSGESGRYYGESRRVSASRSVQRDWCCSERRSHCARFTHFLQINCSIFMLPTRCIPRHSSQSCACHSSRCFSLGRCHILCCHLLHLLTGPHLSFNFLSFVNCLMNIYSKYIFVNTSHDLTLNSTCVKGSVKQVRK